MRSIFFSTFWLSVAFFVWTIRQTFAAPVLSGPGSISACEVVTFNWSNSTGPVTFYVNDVMNAIIVNTSSFTLRAPALEGTSAQFYVIDATNERSNTLQYAIQSGSTTCEVPSATSRASSSFSTPVPSASTTYRSSSASISTYSTVVSTSRPAPTSSFTSLTVVASGVTTSAHGPSVNNTASTSRQIYISKIVIVISVVSIVVGLILIALCCWVRYRIKRRRTLEGDPKNEKRFDWLVPGVKRVKTGSKNRSRALLTEGDQEERLNAEPTTPWETSSELPSASVERLPAAHPPQPQVHILPSSKELRMRAAQGMYSGRDLEAGTSMSEMSGPVSTVHSTSIWPSVSESDEGHANAPRPQPAARADRRREDPRSLQAIIQRELQQIIQHNQLNADSSQTTPQRESSLPTNSSTDLTNSHLDTVDEEPSNPFGDLKAPLRLDIPSGTVSREDLLRSATLASALESSAQGRTPISRRDMELLADLVAERLGRRRESAATPSEINHHDAPPPSYS